MTDLVRAKLKQRNYLYSEISMLYHNIAAKQGISNSIQCILYVLCDNENSCLQSDIYKFFGLSRQTINSAIQNLENDGIIYLSKGTGRNTIVHLTEKGKLFALKKIYPLFKIEYEIFSEWSDEEQQEYLRLMEKYRDALKLRVSLL